MKRKTLIIAVSILLLGIFLCVAYYYFYFKKGVIYDLVNIEFSGISPVETSAIKITGITPVNKKIAIDIHRKIESHDIPGYYQSIEIVVPDTLISKITSIHTTLKGKVYTYKINDLHSIASSPNAHIYVLPPEVKSEQTFFNKLFSAYPFNLVLQVFNVVSSISNIVLSILLYITGILLIIFCIVFVWKFIADILQKSFFLASHNNPVIADGICQWLHSANSYLS